MTHAATHTKRFPWQSAAVIAVLWMVSAAVFVLLENAALVFLAAAFATVAIIVASALPEQARTVADYAFRYRWALAGLVFIACVVLRIHGSSIGVYDEVFATQITPGDSTVFGKPRWIRSDEFGVSTPLFFSQVFNGFSLFSQQISLSPTNMVVDYYSPVWNIAAIGKPLFWGYLLFGNEVGLSWYWCSEEILIFMTALEMCLVLTRGRRFESTLGAIAIWLAPQTQWWVVPHIPIVFMYAMGLFSLGYAFFTASTQRAKWACAAGAVVALVGFSLSVFPSLQVPCTYIVVTLLVVCLLRDRERISFTPRDVPKLALALFAALGILAYILAISKTDISLLLNTVYPGARMYTGGGTELSSLFPNLMCLYLPFADSTFLNNCEVATSIHFAPLFLLLLPRMFPHLRRSMNGNVLVGITLACILLIETIIMVIGMPQLVAEITMLRFCNRLSLVYGWTAVLFTIWGLSALLQHSDMLHTSEKIAYPLAYGALSLVLVNAHVRDYFAHLELAGTNVGWIALAIACAGLVIVLASAFFQQRFLLGSIFSLLLVVGGATINPIEQGASAITNHPISAEISDIAANEPESRWLCTDCASFISNYVAANGARAIDATNYYPDIEKWQIVDPAGIYNEQTNRYANESAQIARGENRVELVTPDGIMLCLNPSTLKQLDVRYLLSRVDYTELLSEYGISCDCIITQDGYGIYRLGEVVP